MQIPIMYIKEETPTPVLAKHPFKLSSPPPELAHLNNTPKKSRIIPLFLQMSTFTLVGGALLFAVHYWRIRK